MVIDTAGTETTWPCPPVLHNQWCHSCLECSSCPILPQLNRENTFIYILKHMLNCVSSIKYKCTSFFTVCDYRLSGCNAFAELCIAPRPGLIVHHRDLVHDNWANYFQADRTAKQQRHCLVCDKYKNLRCYEVKLVAIKRTLKVKFSQNGLSTFKSHKCAAFFK
jgi:hypothetical protein